MKKLIVLPLITLLLSSCDPVAQMEANIENTTSQNLSIAFVSSETDLSQTLEIASGQTILFQEGFDVGSTFLEPSLVEFDSVVIRNQADLILRVYKENDTGKNIYGIDEYWESSEPSKRFLIYNYQIENTDLE